MLARVTVYWHGQESKESIAVTGTRLRPGHCAVDPKKIPYGSRVIFPDGQAVAVDTGPAVINRAAARRAGKTPIQRDAIVIDRYFVTKAQALAWVEKNPHFMTVQVIAPEPKSGRKSVPDVKDADRLKPVTENGTTIGFQDPKTHGLHGAM